eukprot:254229-Rhodomonas_salina.1
MSGEMALPGYPGTAHCGTRGRLWPVEAELRPVSTNRSPLPGTVASAIGIASIGSIRPRGTFARKRPSSRIPTRVTSFTPPRNSENLERTAGINTATTTTASRGTNDKL